MALPNEPELIGFELTHSLLRAELARLADAFALGIAEGDTDVVEDHLRLVVEHLVRHHREEDSYHWPLLARRAPELREILAQLEAEHATFDTLIPLVVDRSADPFERHEALAQLAASVGDHFDDEDRIVIPALRRHVTAEEQATSMERSRRQIPASDELRVLSLMLASGTAAQQHRMLALLPPEAIEAWRTIGAPQLEELHRRLAATPSAETTSGPGARS